MPRTRYGVSPWIHQFPDSRRRDYPRAKGELDRDVVIIGGGLTGCAAAYACAAAGVRAVVLEAERVGHHGAGRSAGLLLPDPGPTFRSVSQAHGLRLARTAFQTWRRAALDAAALLRRLGIKCGLDAHDALVVAPREDEKTVRRELEARDAAGLDGTWLVRKQLLAAAALDASGAIKMREAFGLDPYRACVGLAAAAAKRGVPIYERTPVRKVRVGRKQVEVIAEGTTIRAQTVVVATGTATAEYGQLRRHFSAREAYLVLTEVVPAGVRRMLGTRGATIADTRTPRHRIRFTADDRILVGGADQPATPERKRDAVLVQRTGQLMYELLTMYPVISGLTPEYGWELAYGETADGLPYIGPHRNFPRHLFALGSGGDSVTGAFLAARIVLRNLQGTPDKTDAVFGWTR
jgi:glycine/D-amino acid oxidase-like deaminating enzyme